MAADVKTRQGAREGAVSPFVLVALVALLAASALAVDAGVLWTARTQLQGTVDAAALAAAASLIDPTGPSVTRDGAVAAGSAVAGANRAVPEAGVELAEVQIGSWDPDARRFDTGIDLTDPAQVNAVDVIARLDGTSNRAVPAFLARVLGRESFTVAASATAWLGFAGNAPPGAVDLPIAIDCCAIRGPACENDYCDTIANPPNPCDFAEPSPQGPPRIYGVRQATDTGPVTCFDMNGTPVQNACWTNFEPPNTNINTPLLSSLVNSGNAFEVSTGVAVRLDSGEKTPVFEDIAERFMAEAKDRYDPFGDKDSWVVRLAVVSCQQGSPSCNEGVIKGFVCFEVRQVEVTSSKIIRGRFLCRDDAAFEDCDIGGSSAGGDDFDIQAALPVLVR
jgi:hypothetical protein